MKKEERISKELDRIFEDEYGTLTSGEFEYAKTRIKKLIEREFTEEITIN